MAKNSYAGHSKNLSSFEALIDFCTIHADKYRPSNPLIQTTALQQKQSEVAAILENTRAAKTIYSNVTNDREIVFADLQRLSTRIINALKASGVATQTINDAKTSHRKIHGRKKKPKETSTETTGNTNPKASPEPSRQNSTQLSYDAQVENFASLVATVAAEPHYQPNEADLTISTLQNKLNQLKGANTAVITVINRINMIRGQRDKAIYDPNEGLCLMAAEVKQYVRSIYGSTSHEAKEVGAMRFINHKE